MRDGSHPGSAYEQRLAQFFRTIDFDELTTHAIRYTVRKHKQRAYRFRTPPDYFNEAIMLIMDLRRIFDFEGTKSFEQFVESVIDSLVSHDLEKAARLVQIVDRGDVEEGEALGGFDAGRLVATERTDEVIDRIDAEKRDAKLPPELQQYRKLRRSGQCRTAKEFAVQMGIKVSDIRNIERRLARGAQQCAQSTI
jgi:hypothetical protein